MTVIAFKGKKNTREIWAYIRANNLGEKLKKHSSKKITDIRRGDLLSFLESLEKI